MTRSSSSFLFTDTGTRVDADADTVLPRDGEIGGIEEAGLSFLAWWMATLELEFRVRGESAPYHLDT